ncbi:MAG: efflux RND transporter periplasmic adaptor subunit [Candidatus Sumerlaeia bacterium]|nr:efflux RND transporter periplasmic adaptor subunit [Candidatus Sumerlaeia bacterium]
MKKLFIIIGILAIAGGSAAYIIRRNDRNASKDDPRIRFVKVERGPVSLSVSSTGRVIANLDVDIKCKASGQIISLPYDVSDKVTSGTILMELDPIDEERRVRQAEVRLAASQARLAQAEKALQVAERNLETEKKRAEAALKSSEARAADARAKADRMKQLFEKKLASQEEYDTAETAAVQAAADLQNAKVKLEELKTQEISVEMKRQDVALAKGDVESDRINLSLAQQQLKDTKVRAPMDAVVAARNVQIGQIIASGVSNVGGGTTIMTLSDLSHLFILAAVDESDIGRVKEGQQVMITADAYPGVMFQGRVVRIATRGVNTQNVVTFEVKIEVTSNNKDMLKPEMTTNVEIIAAQKDDVLVIPSEAISRRRGQPTVLVKNDDGTSVSREVEIGVNDGFRAEVISGLDEGETVVVRRGEAERRWRGGGPGGPGGPRGMMMMGGSMRGGPGRR